MGMFVGMFMQDKRFGKRWGVYHVEMRALGARVEMCEKELEIQGHDGPSEFGRGRRRRLWLQELEKQELSPEERRAWESGM